MGHDGNAEHFIARADDNFLVSEADHSVDSFVKKLKKRILLSHVQCGDELKIFDCQKLRTEDCSINLSIND